MFKEFSNPEEADYDINSVYEEEKPLEEPSKFNKVETAFQELLFELGVPEVYELEPYGITEKEYEYPTLDTLRKLQVYAKEMDIKNKKHKH